MPNVERICGAARWASYLINGDSSGLEPEEIEACDNWAARELSDDGSCVDCDEPFFSWSYGLHCHVDPIGGDLVEYTILRR